MAAEKIDALELDIEAKLSAENLDKLIDRLALLGKMLDNLKGKSVSVNIKETGNASEKASSQVDKLTDSFLHQAVKITALIAVYRKLTNWISDGINSSMSYTENLNLFTVSLGEYAENANKYANTVREALGIDPSGWIRTQGFLNTLIEGFGVGAEQAAYMSQNLTQLTYDLASYANISIADAEKKIQSAVAGELEPVRRLGYDLSQNALTAIAQNPEYYGKTTYSINQETGAIEANTEALEDNTARVVANFNDLTQAEKVQLRYIALMTQVTEAQTDLSRSLNDPANQMRIFKEQTEMTSRALGNAFIPMLNKAMPYVIAFARVLEETFQKIAAYLGYELPDMSDRINVDDSVGGYEDVEDALEGGAKAAKKIRDYTIGIDELNVLRPDDNTGRGSGSDNQYALGSIYATPGYDFLGTAIENSINNAKKQIEDFAAYLSTLDPLKVVGYFAWEGLGEIGVGVIEWITGYTPEELAQKAAQEGKTIPAAFVEAIFSNPTDWALSLCSFLFGKTADELGQEAADLGVSVGGLLVSHIFRNTTNKGFWWLLFGKTPEDIRNEAETEGYSLGYAYIKNFFEGGHTLLATAAKGQANFVRWAIYKLFGYETDTDMLDDVAKQAQSLGISFGEYLSLGIAKAIVQAFADNPVLTELYEVATGRDIEKDLESLEKKLEGYNDTAHSGGGGSGRTRNREYSKTDADRNLTGYDWGTAKNAKSHGSELAKSFADGIKSGIGDIESATQGAYNTALDGVSNKGMGASDFLRVSLEEINGYVKGIRSGYSKGYAAGKELFSSTYTGVTSDGNGGTKYYNTASDNVLNYINGILSGKDNVGNAGSELAKAFTDMLGSQTAKDDSYDAGVEVSRHGALGSWAYKDDYYDAGAMSGEGFAHGIISKIEEAEEAGKGVALKTLGLMKEVLDERSPSHEAEKIGKFFSQGYAVGILDDMDKATSAVETMAKASIRAANTDFISDVSVSIPRSNAGYGIGMANESAMASLASNIYQAVVSGMAMSNNNGGDTIITIDGREVFRVVQSEARKNGAQISNGAFSR